MQRKQRCEYQERTVLNRLSRRDDGPMSFQRAFHHRSARMSRDPEAFGAARAGAIRGRQREGECVDARQGSRYCAARLPERLRLQRAAEQREQHVRAEGAHVPSATYLCSSNADVSNL